MSFIPKVFGRFPQNKKRLKRIQQSPSYYLGRFHNSSAFAPIPYWQLMKMMPAVLFGSKKLREPQKALPIDFNEWDTSDAGRFWWSWLGHSSLVINLDGQTVVIDPMLSKRASPFKMLGPKRFHPAPEQILNLKKIDVAIISHDHYDHLDYKTIKLLRDRVKHFVVPLGIGEHLEFWKIKPSRIVELDWWESVEFGKVKIVATPAQHASGRWTGADNQTLWASWVIKGRSQNLFYSGDSGFFKEWADIGNHYGPFDIGFIQCGAYNKLWKYHHMTPAEVIETHKLIQSKVLVPVHWSTFDLAVHKWYEPVSKLKTLALKENARIMFPILGKQNFVARQSTAPYWWEEYLPRK